MRSNEHRVRRWPRSLRWLVHKAAARSAWLAAFVARQRPDTFEGWTDGFNGQRERRRMMGEITRAVAFDAFIETGTNRGATASYVRKKFDLPVWTVELLPRLFHLCRWRFMDDPGVHLFSGDSRPFLREIAARVPGTRCLFYLDAHWYDDLPLFDELEIISTHWPAWVVVIDDFRVDDDPKYYWDAYGPGRSLELANLPWAALGQVGAYFPTATGLEESFPWRGCVVLARGTEIVDALDRCATLRRVEGFGDADR